MQFSKKQMNQLRRILETTQQLLAEAGRQTAGSKGNSASGAISRRRVGKELASFKKTIKSERKAGTSVADLARKHGVTPSYIYQLG